MDETQDLNNMQEDSQEFELSHSDKAIGILTEPGKTFAETAKYPPKTIDWLLPFTLLLLVIAVSNVLMMTNENIAYELKQKQLEAVEKQFDAAVQKGQMTRDQANEQMDKIEESMNMSAPVTLIITVVTIFIGGFIMFFIVTGIYFLFVKMLKGDGSYSSALVANGLTSYIGIIQVLAATVLAFVLGKLIKDVSVASLIGADTSNFAGFLLGKLDVISIWAYLVLGIGLAKMFKSTNTVKYIIMVLVVWLVGSTLLFVVSKAVPFLSFLNA